MNNNNLADWTESVRKGVGDALNQVAAGIPEILAAILVLIIGVIVAAILKGVVVRVLRLIKIKPWTDKVGLSEIFTGKMDVAGLVGDLVKWFFIIVFLLQALTIVNLEQVTEIVEGLLAYVPNVVAAAAVVFVGAVVADLTSRIVTNAAQALSGDTARLLGNGAKYTIWAVVVFTALAQLGVNTLFLDRLFTAIVVMLALAGGLAFGLGGRDAAKDALDNVRSNLKRG